MMRTGTATLFAALGVLLWLHADARIVPPAPAASAAAPSPETVRKDANRVHRAALARLGSDFACVQTPAQGDQLRLHLLVTSLRAKERGQRLVRNIRSSRVASVRIVSRRYRRTTLRRIFERLKETLPAEDRSQVGLSFPERPSDHYSARCREIYVTFAPSRISERGNAWAQEARRRYGRDRISLIELTTPVAASP